MKRGHPARGIILRRGSYWFNLTVGGKREWFNLETSDFAEAIRRARGIREKPTVATHDNLAGAAQRFIAWKISHGQYGGNTVERVRYTLAGLVKHCGEGADLASVKAPQLQSWYDKLRTEVSLLTAKNYVMTVRAFFRWAVETEHVRASNPAKDVKMLPVTRTARVLYADATLRDHLIADASNDDMRFILYAGFHAGLRRAEIVEARNFWFDLKNGFLRVQSTPLARGVKPHGWDLRKDAYGRMVRPFQPKGKKDRTVPLTKSFAAFLADYLREDPADFTLQPNATHAKARYRYDFRVPFTEYMRAKKNPWITPHVLRHTFASLLVIKGVSLYKVAGWIGDTIAITEKHYAHLAPVDADIHRLE